MSIPSSSQSKMYYEDKLYDIILQSVGTSLLEANQQPLQGTQVLKLCNKEGNENVILLVLQCSNYG